ncbi:LuxR C-terminal-related transcriptional regulator [Corynebacterium sp. A21]|uniref:LuxR C-terminal-related transcriptional regulator n=1 Tax=Corynebacterium sp. A21 TaxID=3457318 RepID=UPI003FD519A3
MTLHAVTEFISPKLTAREIEVSLAWLAAASKSRAGSALHITADTVSSHIASVRKKYLAVGRPAASKSDLLLRLMEDQIYRPDAYRG